MLYSKGPQVEMNFVDEQELMGIREVWRDNFEKEIRILMEKIEKYNYIAMVKQAVSGNIEEEHCIGWETGHGVLWNQICLVDQFLKQSRPICKETKSNGKIKGEIGGFKVLKEKKRKPVVIEC